MAAFHVILADGSMLKIESTRWQSALHNGEKYFAFYAEGSVNLDTKLSIERQDSYKLDALIAADSVISIFQPTKVKISDPLDNED